MENTRSRGDRYALSALRNKRAAIASDIMQTERKLQHLRSSLVHVDATLKLLDPEADPEAIPTKRPTARVKLFRQGELSRMVLDALRRAPVSGISAPHIVSEILATGGHSESARKAVSGRVRGTLAYLVRGGRVRKVGSFRDAKWLAL